MRERIDLDRRRLVGAAAMTMAAAPLGLLTASRFNDESRELAAIGRATEWINSPPLNAVSLRDRVVLVQFCTYTCINWRRTLPYMRAWAQKYRQDLVVIGVHTPEFDFEHDVDNVRRAMQQMQVDYPIVIDNDYSIWRAFGNQYWPALYLFDERGRIRHHHFGEGEYQQSELAAHQLLPDRTVAHTFVSVTGAGVEAPPDWSNLKSEETHLGNSLTLASPLQRMDWSLSGAWTVGRECARLGKPLGRIAYRFRARDLHLVMTPPPAGGRIRFRVTLDRQPPAAASGLDVDDYGNGVVTEPRLYQLIRQPGAVVERRFEIEFLDAGIEAFAFTFG